MTVVHSGGNLDWTFNVRRDMELVADQRRPSRLDGVIVGDRVDRPYFVIIDKLSLQIYRTVGEAMCAFVKGPIRLQEAAMVDVFPSTVLHGELGPGLIEVPDLGDQRVADVLVLDNHQRLDCVVG